MTIREVLLLFTEFRLGRSAPQQDGGGFGGGRIPSILAAPSMFHAIEARKAALMNTPEMRFSDPALAHLPSLLPELEALYTDVHAHPELSVQETRTAGLAADHLRAAGYDVTTAVGKTGVVGLLRNGTGPTVMLRADMDALPVEEATALPYASKPGPRIATERRCRSCMPAAKICMLPGLSVRRRSSRKPVTPGAGP
jgi:hypothetical protein